MNNSGENGEKIPHNFVEQNIQEGQMDIPYVTPEDRRNAKKQLEKPLAVEEGEDGETKLSAENAKITIQKTNLDQREADELAEFKRKNEHGLGNSKNDVSVRELPNAEEWQRLDRFVVNNGQEEKDFTKIMPEMRHYKIFFCPSLAQDKHSVATDEANKNIYVMGNMTSLLDIVELLHKIGHVWESSGMDSNVENMDSQDAMLKKEYNATHFTMKMLKPFLVGQNGKNIENVVYGNYHEYVEEMNGSVQDPHHKNVRDGQIDRPELEK
ncbi:MAG: hypothetical protein WC819_05260 [Parcubacteria group bacterium]|jgi:hypothetical protein